MASSKELKALITLAGKIDPSLQSAMLKASKESMKLSDNAKKSGTMLSKVGTIAKGVFLGNLASKAVSKIGDSLLETAKKGIELASDLNEVQNVVDVTFGKNSKAINDWSKQTLNAFGLSELQAKQFSGTMGAMLKSTGLTGDSVVKMSEKLTGLSGDMASFYNISQDEAFEKIRSGISGETEPLKQLGINMSVANLQAYALSKGIKTSYDKMDQASQTALRYSYLMNVSKDAQGDFARTSGGFANQQRLLKTRFEQISATIASKFLPKLTELAQKVNDFLSKVDAEKVADKISAGFDILGKTFKFVTDNANILIPVAAGLASTFVAFSIVSPIVQAFRKWKEVNKDLTFVQWAMNLAMEACPIVLIATGIGLAVAAGVALYKNWDKVSAAAGTLWSGIKAAFGDGVNWVIDKLNGLIKIINKIPGINIPLIPKLQGSTSTALTTSKKGGMQEFAVGGIANSPSIFGEAGPEMAIPLDRTPRSLGLLSQASQILGIKSSSERPNIIINLAVNTSSDNPKEVARETKDTLEETILNILDKYFGDEERVSFE